MLIGFAYDLIDDYLAQGYSAEQAAEFDSPITIDCIQKALEANGHTVERIGGIKALAAALVAGKRWDLVFNITEGMFGLGREAQVPALLDAYQIPYTFSPTEVMVITMDKGMAKRIVRDAGVTTTGFAIVNNAVEAKAVTLPYPLFVKPLADGTSKGVSEKSVVRSEAELIERCREVNENFGQPALVETFLSGREFTVGILGGGETARVVGVMEITFAPEGDQSCYSYRNKVDAHDILTVVDDADSRRAGALGLAAWRVLGCCDGGRIDVRLDEKGVPHFIEANPLAGLRPDYSEFPVLAKQAGIAYEKLIGTIVEEAAKRQGVWGKHENRRIA
ncbi:MAG: D-alanine--D-alanine ligase [Alphaproteobacteria bacterium]|nr:D-alanine--D-alanine ligase [Alphaproteobacteria bacterium]